MEGIGQTVEVSVLYRSLGRVTQPRKALTYVYTYTYTYTYTRTPSIHPLVAHSYGSYTRSHNYTAHTC
jgi:hypothetical protein